MIDWYYDNLKVLNAIGNSDLEAQMRQHLMAELRATTRGLEEMLEGAEWLSRPEERHVNKVAALGKAREAGLLIPATLITTDRAELQAFKDRYGRVITKPTWEAKAFYQGNECYAMYTEEVTQPRIDAAPERFFPSLVQEMIPKAFEIRVFFLDGECFAMAIFSQRDPQTQMDFRRYNDSTPNRNVPYRLPEEVADAITKFMRAMSLATGSIDLIRTPDGQHVFLEVNPVGQFKMVSNPCNYQLERRVAEYLIRKDADVRSSRGQAPAVAPSSRAVPGWLVAPKLFADAHCTAGGDELRNGDEHALSRT